MNKYLIMIGLGILLITLSGCIAELVDADDVNFYNGDLNISRSDINSVTFGLIRAYMDGNFEAQCVTYSDGNTMCGFADVNGWTISGGSGGDNNSVQFFGEMTGDHEDSSHIVTITDANVDYQITGFSAGDLKGFTYSDNNLIATYDGNYLADFSISFEGGANNTYDVAIAVNSVIVKDCYSQRKLGSGGDVGNTGGTCVGELSAGDKITLVVHDETEPTSNIGVKMVNVRMYGVRNTTTMVDLFGDTNCEIAGSCGQVGYMNYANNGDFNTARVFVGEVCDVNNNVCYSPEDLNINSGGAGTSDNNIYSLGIMDFDTNSFLIDVNTSTLTDGVASLNSGDLNGLVLVDFLADAGGGAYKGDIAVNQDVASGFTLYETYTDVWGELKRDDLLKDYWGSGDDASIYYDGTDLNINPKEVGSGIVNVQGDLNADGRICDSIGCIGSGGGAGASFDGNLSAIDPTYYLDNNSDGYVSFWSKTNGNNHADTRGTQLDEPATTSYDLNFDGVDEYVSIADASELDIADQNLSISMWVNTNYAGSEETDDDFTGQIIDTTKWSGLPAGATMSGNLSWNGTTSGSTNSLNIFGVTGDFDIRIDFSNISFPNETASRLQLGVFRVSDTDYGMHVERGRQVAIGSGHYLRTDRVPGFNAGTFATTTDTSGILRITRSGSTFTGYYWNGSGWTTLTPNATTATFSDEAYILLRFFAPASGAIATFDDFNLASAESTSTYVAPQTLWDKHPTGTDDGYALRITDDGYLKFYGWENGTEDETEASSDAVNDGSWHHVVATFNESTKDVNLFVDGTEVSSYSKQESHLTSLANTQSVRIARDNLDAKEFRGEIDEIGLWKRVLTSGEVSNLYDSGSGQYITQALYPNIQGLWHLDDGTGSTADEPINNNDGTLTNMEEADWITPGHITAAATKRDVNYITCIDGQRAGLYGECEFGSDTIDSYLDGDIVGFRLDGTEEIRVANNGFYQPDVNGDLNLSVNVDGSQTTAIQVNGDTGSVTMPNQSTVRIRKNTTQVISASTWTKVQYNNEITDTLGEYDPTTNYRFTAKDDGVYVVSAYMMYNTASLSVNYISIYRNGSALYNSSAGGLAAYQTNHIVKPVKLTAGQYVEIYVWQNAGSRTIHSDTLFSNLNIVKVA